jgi:hypothetical protein
MTITLFADREASDGLAVGWYGSGSIIFGPVMRCEILLVA